MVCREKQPVLPTLGSTASGAGLMFQNACAMVSPYTQPSSKRAVTSTAVAA